MIYHKKKNITHTSFWKYENSEKKLINLKVYILNKINKFLFKFSKYQLKSEILNDDRNSKILSKKDIDYRNSLLTVEIKKLFVKIGLKQSNNIKSLIKEYDKIYYNSPLKNNDGGMGYNNGLITYLIVRTINPKTIIESGVWRGFTTFLFHKATRIKTKIYSFDINLSNIEYRSKKSEYFEKDIENEKNIDFSNFDLAFFDDHVSHYDRILFCIKNKIKFVILDDDVSSFGAFSDGWPPIPTANMIFNYNKISKHIRWKRNNSYAYANISNIDIKYILKDYRLLNYPNISELTGYRNMSPTSLLILK